MRRALVVVAVMLGGCKKDGTTCERFVDMVAKCEASTEDRDMANKLCSAFEDSTDKDKTDVFIRKMHQCAVTATECPAFEDCLDGVAAEKAGASVPPVVEGARMMTELTGALTAAIGATKDCDAQTRFVRGTLAAKASQVTRLRTLMIDRKVQSAIAKSERTGRATKAFNAAIACRPPLEAYAEAFANIELPPRPTSLTGPKASADECNLGAGMFAQLVTMHIRPSPEPMRTRVVAAIVKRCATDGWTKEVANCYEQGSDLEKVPLCEALLTKPMSDALAADLKAAYGE